MKQGPEYTKFKEVVAEYAAKKKEVDQVVRELHVFEREQLFRYPYHLVIDELGTAPVHRLADGTWELELGVSIIQVTEYLVSYAVETAESVSLLFNDVLLTVGPGSTVEGAIAEWEARRRQRVESSS